MLATRMLSALSLALSIGGVASFSSSRVVHETRGRVPLGWSPMRRADSSMILPMRIGLVQPNLENIESYIMDVSHPDSPNYGQHWSPARVAQTFRPTQESVNTVIGWLVDNGIEAERVTLSYGGGWVLTNVTIDEAESLLGTEYYVYQYGDDESHTHIGCHERYHLPEDVAKHVELVTPTLHFDAKPKAAPVQYSKYDKKDGSQNNASAQSVGQPNFGTSFPKTSGTISTIISELEDCDEQIVPDCLRALYSFVYEPFAADKNSIAIVEYTPQGYIADDLDMFFANFSPSQVGERPILDSIDGGVLSNYGGFGYAGESNLDLQYSMSLVTGKQPVTLYQAGDLYEGASFDNLLDALDASYCTFEGGDNPEYDATYPDPYGVGYQGPENCGTITPAYIMSTSYGYTEADLTPAYAQRQCAEYAKLGLLGTTILYSSGDEGVAGQYGICLDSEGYEDYYGDIFAPTFPGGCPYVTSVGATQVNPNATVWEPESACEQVIYSGGGFSNVFARPKYQKAAVEHYLTTYPPPYASDIYNATSRGFPDISANGANYVVAVSGEYYLVYGTSCSSPVSAAIFSAINDARLAIGKGPIGFINPTIYTPVFMAAFNDITSGSNPGCGTEGFYAQPGWDPVTGVGTPNFVKLLALWLLLP
ncbi:subtilisin-like protein [Laetiporus sulphureus 93-53]|uniref:tripeptidyl-peptidase II n=1 Tax=Laetiporus sulphureus 93-53 TaxID=1314785 RepID=A0A165D2B2_9APHY|nr:subtilisin-like protein [Laetiporus sulphureus 93-53]KZT04012.1 subtilisin-like protein [Laetiporus sulphureus 93-53]